MSTASTRTIRELVLGLGLDHIKLSTTGKPVKRASNGGPKAAAASNDETYGYGGRNNLLTSLAGGMRRRGMDEQAIAAALLIQNQKFTDPLEGHEVLTIARSIARYETEAATSLAESLNDTGNAERFAKAVGADLRYAPGIGWVRWTGLRWLADDCGYVIEQAKNVARSMFAEAEALPENVLRVAMWKHAKKSLQAGSLKAMVELASSHPDLMIAADVLDNNDMALGVGNGIVDLQTGKLGPSRREAYLTKHSPVNFDPKAKCPTFLKFIDTVTGGDKELARYLQRVVGYALTGLTGEQCLFFLYGHGANGKSTFISVLKMLLGDDLACQTPSETIMVRRSGATNDLARLHGKRVAIANEVEDGAMLAESLVKQITGEDPIAARFLFKEYFEFRPKFKLFITGNHKPVIRGRDHGIWRRIRLIPFTVTIPKSEQDPALLTKLKAELPGILNWAITGCLDWQQKRLAEPEVVTQAVNDYRAEMDLLKQWTDECCDVASKLECKASDAYRSYKAWAEKNGYRPMASGNFSRDLADVYKKVKRKTGNFFIGLGPKDGPIFRT